MGSWWTVFQSSITCSILFVENEREFLYKSLTGDEKLASLRVSKSKNILTRFGRAFIISNKIKSAERKITLQLGYFKENLLLWFSYNLNKMNCATLKWAIGVFEVHTGREKENFLRNYIHLQFVYMLADCVIVRRFEFCLEPTLRIWLSSILSNRRTSLTINSRLLLHDNER